MNDPYNLSYYEEIKLSPFAKCVTSLLFTGKEIKLFDGVYSVTVSELLERFPPLYNPILTIYARAGRKP